MSWKENKREQGFRDVMVWLPPEAAAALDALKAYRADMSVTDIIAKCLVSVAHHTTGAGFEVPIADIGLKERLDGMEARLEALEGQGRKSTSEGRQGQTGFGSRGPRPRVDRDLLLERIAARIRRDGWDFNISQLHRELLNEGINVHQRHSGFWTFIKNHRDILDEALT